MTNPTEERKQVERNIAAEMMRDMKTWMHDIVSVPKIRFFTKEDKN